MSLKPRAPRAMPAELAALEGMIFESKKGSPYQLVGNQLYEKYRDEEYVDSYSQEGKPGLSPVLLGFVTVFQDLERSSDREAVDAVLVRLDWKYALHLPLDYEGFDFSVSSEYRTRLVKHGAEGRMFERIHGEVRRIEATRAAADRQSGNRTDIESVGVGGGDVAGHGARDCGAR